ncbi:MAG: hypothetical protein P8Y69_14355 [Gammaproteobacteria bacterium]|jgi:hypothetical protein
MNRRIVYSSWRRGTFDLYLKSIDGAAEADPLLATTNYDVAHNGERFLVNRPTSDVNAHRVEIIQNWRALLPH